MLSFVHITDLHFSATPGVYSFIGAALSERYQAGVGIVQDFFNGRHSPEIAEIAADFIQRRLGDHDCILLTGDLATRGTQSDLQTARDYVLSPSANGTTYQTSTGRPTLSVGNRPVVLLPGNHDRFEDSKCVPGGTMFDSVFGDKWTKGPQSVQVNAVCGLDGTTINVICADFTLPSAQHADPPAFFPGQGRCIEDVVRELSRVTLASRVKYPRRGIIWVSHFPPSFPNEPVGRLLELVDSHFLLDAARNCGIKYLICGHTHRQYYVDAADIILIVGGTACMLHSSNGNWINSLRFEVNNGEADIVEFSSFEFSQEDKDFVYRP
ncbi:metallophosphoesterase [Methylobacterium sp. J-030]|uniref:metallophosphoesterase family protein n=1 Tax=Methylobacterium sp. J-030 TaxID=2836627 RepID=UPI001FBACE59|nr:metallophosphoesterase [Methylobacterium sp. J-030]MCJ2068313.1 metallophosphoesterase [Methylobacterium sp. J-030]